jgi:hypothetical protein
MKIDIPPIKNKGKNKHIHGEITGAFGAVAAPLLPQKERDPHRECQRKPGGGRPPINPRKALEAVHSWIN